MRRWGLRFLSVALCVGWAGVQAGWAVDFWTQGFGAGTPGAKPAGWYDDGDDQSFHAMMYYPATDGYANVTVTTGQTWGKVLSFSQNVDVTTYPKIEIVVSAVNSGGIKVGVFIPSPWEEHVSASAITSAGTYVIDIPALSGGWSGTKNMGIQLVAEGTGGSIVIDSIRIFDGAVPNSPTASPTTNPNSPTYTPTSTHTPTSTPYAGTPTFTPTITPTPANTSTFTITNTPVTTNLWLEHFAGTFGAKPPNWEDDTDVAGNKARITYVGDSYSTWVKVSRTAADTWGKIASPAKYADMSRFSEVEVGVISVGNGAAWKLGVQEIGGQGAYKDLAASKTTIGAYSFNFADVMGWAKTGSGDLTHTFQFVVIVEGQPGAYVVLDYIRIYSNGIPPTPTATPEVYSAWNTTFELVPGGRGAPNEKPDLWLDEGADSGKNMYIRYSYTNGYAYLSRTAEAKYGVVMAPAVRADVDRYKYIRIDVKSVSPGAKWKIGVQETSRDKAYVDACPVSSLIGEYVFEYPVAMAAANGITWNGVRDFNLLLIVEGPAGATVEVSEFALFAYGTAPTPTITVTSTITPWVQQRETLAYPNPAFDKVTFGYLAEGAVTVNLDVFKLTGEKVAGITEERVGQPQEILKTVWDAASIPSGIYFCHVKVVGHGGRVWVDVFKKVAIAK